MTEPARHTDAIRTHEILRIVVTRIAVVALRIPLACCFSVKRRVREETQTDDACCVAVNEPTGIVCGRC